jgi:MFS family permease
MSTDPSRDAALDQPVEPASPAFVEAIVEQRAGRSRGNWRVLGNRNYALLFWGQLISSTGTQMQVVAVAWQVLLLTNNPIALGLLGLVQAIPRLIFSLVGGIFADMLDRRKLLIVIEAVMASMSAILALCTIFHVINPAIIYSVVLVSASVSAFEYPTRQAIVPSLVKREQMAAALALNTVMMQFTLIAGPTAGGFAIAWLGVANTYWFDVVSYAVVIGSLLLMTVPRVPAEKRAQGGMSALADGMRFLRAHPIILAVLSLDFFATFFGSPRALLPIYANDILHIGPQGLGILQAATPIGAVVMAPLTGLVSRVRRQGLGVALAVIFWGLSIIAFGLFPSPVWLGVLFLAGSGAADMVSMILRSLVVQLTTPDEFRGRISAVYAMFAIGGPMLGQFESGLVAGIFTPLLSVVSGGAACIVAALVIVALVPSLAKVRVK